MKLAAILIVAFGVGIMAGFIPYIATMQNNHEGRHHK